MAINAGSVYSELILNGDKYFSTLEKAEKQVETFQKKLENAGKNMEKAGEKLSKYVTAPIVGIGAVATKLGLDFEAAMSEVGAISGATGDDLAKLEEKAREMGATTKFSASDAAAGLKYMAMAGWETEQMLAGLPGVLALAAASGEDLALVSDIVTDAMTAFGLAASEAGHFADVLAKASSSSNTNVALMGETFKYVAPLAGSLNYTIEDTAHAIGLMANAGIKGSQAGTALRSMITRMVKPTKESGTAMDMLGISITNTDGSMKSLAEVMDDLRKAFKNLDPDQQAFYSAQIAGQEAMSGFLAIVNASEEDFTKLRYNIYNATGAAKEMSDMMQDNLKGRWEEFKSALEEVALQIYDIILPSLEKFLEKIQGLVDWFLALDEGTKETILKMAGLAAAIGPLLVIGGKMTQGLSSMIGLFTKLGSATKLATTTTASLGTAAKASTLLLNPWTAAIAAGGLVAYGLYKNLSEDAIPAIDLFGDSVSENTQKAVSGFLELDEQASMALKQMSWSGQEVTEEMANIITGNINAMKDQVVSKLEEQKTEAISSMQEMVTNAITMTQEEKDEILRITEESYDKQIHSNEVRAREINQILEKASEERRQLTQEERERILELQEGMKEDAVRILSESEAEQMAIMERLKANSSELSAQQAAEIVKNSVEQKEKTIAEAETEYTERLKYAAQLRAMGGKEAEELADKVVEEAQRQRDEAIKNAEEMHNKVVGQAKLQAGEHVNQVDWETGEIKTKWEVMKEDIIQKAKEIKNNVIEKAEQLKTEYPRKIGELRESIEKKFNKIANDAISWGRDVINGFIKGVTNLKDKAVEKVEEFGDNIASGFKNTLGISSPSRIFEKFGEFTIEGYVKGIEKNKYKAINSIEDVGNIIIKEYDKLGDAVIKALQNKYKEEERLQVNSLNKQINNIREATDKKIQQYNRELAAKLQLIDDEANEEIKRIQSAINAINKKTEEEEKLLKEQAYQAEVAELEKKIAESESAEERAKIQKELNELKADRERELILEQRQMQIDAMYEEINRIREQASKKKLELEKEYENKKEMIEKATEATIAGLEKEIEATKSHYEELLEEERLQAEARILILDENNEELIELLESYNPKWQDAGQSFGESLLFGLNSMKTSIQQAVEDILSLVGKADRAKANIEAQNAVIIQAKKDWEEAYKSGDNEAMEEAHRRAEEARRKGGTIGYDETLEEALKKVGHNALGTNYWRGGLTWVGEQGPELIELPRGSKVYSNQKSMEMISIDEERLASAIIRGLKEEGLSKPANIILDGKAVGKGIVKIIDSELYNNNYSDNIGKGLL